MSCHDYRQLLSGHMDERLSARERTALLAHLDGCAPCAASLARYRQSSVLLRRLPGSTPSPAVRERVLDHRAAFRHGWLLRPRLATVATLVALLFFFGFVSGASAPLVRRALVPAHLPAGGGAVAAVETAPDSLTAGAMDRVSAVDDDAFVLQQVRSSVRRADFRPLIPSYLPRGARLNTVNFGRANPAGPIDQLEVAFAADGRQIRLWQLGTEEAASQRQKVEGSQFRQLAKRIVVGGREWLYLQRPDPGSGSQVIAVLIGQRDGLTIWLESTLPVEELARVANSLHE